MYSKVGNCIGKIVSLNKERFSGSFYLPDEIFQDKNPGWPGDWQGRVLLAIYSQYLIDHKKTKYHDEFLRKYSIFLNAEGYYGETLNTNEINEQQLAGNSWFLRFLVLYFEDTKSEMVYKNIVDVVNNLYLKIAPFVHTYNNVGLLNEGSFAGTLTKLGDNFKYSTDIGCIYIALDGLSHAYHIYKDERLKELIMSLLDKFFKTEIVKDRYQTHATLTALRGAFEFYKETNDKKILNKIIKVFNDYLEYGMTLNNANYNWFNRIDTWTEPCAIIDSFMLSKRLYIETKKEKYLNITYKILYNSLVFSARSNGGFGCDSCVSLNNSVLKAMSDSYEAYWCCTMRGGEFSLDVSKCVYDNNLIVPIPGKHYIDKDEIIIDEGFPYTDGLKINLNFKENKEIVIHFPLSDFNFMYDGICTKKGNKLIIKVNKGASTLVISFKIEFEIINHKNYKTIDYGVLRLAKRISLVNERTFEIENEKYMNVPRSVYYTKEELLKIDVDFKFGGKEIV